MQFGVGAIASIIRRGSLFGALSVLFAVVGLSLSAYAQGSTVQATIDSGTIHPTLALTAPTSPAITNIMPLELMGTLSDLTQIQVHVDDVFSVTIPLNEGATTFTYDLIVPSGSHVVRLVGISPFADNTPTVIFSVAFSPPSNSSGSSTPSGTSNSTTGGAVISHDATASGTTTYAPPAYASSLPSWFYNGLLALDIARPNDTDGKELAKTVQRIVLASTGLFFFAFARAALTVYHKIRYSWLGFSKRPMPQLFRSRPLFAIRIIGMVLISGVFWFV